ncbi:MAG: glycoside hydrolase family 97 protein [Bacteroidales bacterium]|nr:glycoside hydrolase family 97 protein [Bacteroidales bacterium]
MNLLFSLVLAAATILSSPDSRLKVQLGEGSYSISYDGHEMVSRSSLGFITSEDDYSNFSIVSVEYSDGLAEYSLEKIKTSSVSKKYNSALARCITRDGKKFDIEWRVFNNDVAFRYVLPLEGERASVRVMSEETYFRFPEGTTGYLTPQSDAMIGWKRTKPSYEEFYRMNQPLSEVSQYGHGYTFPCLLKVGESGWVLISETGVDSHYCGSRLSDYDSSKGFKLEFPMPEENNGNGTSEPAFSLPGATPWRTLTIGRDLAPIVETTIPFDVVEPRYESAHKYEFGKGTWSWILWQDDSINYEDQVAFIDLSAAMGFKYCLVDNWWHTRIGRDRMAELVKYAASKGISMFLWYSSSGWWNDITQGPINVMSEPIVRKPEMRWLHEIGVKGIKVDFFGGDKQETMRHYEEILSDADDNGLMVIFHGCTIPRGWEKMYPNYVGSEAVRASENLIFSQHDCDIEAQCAALHPFIRNAVASMEYGGSFLNERMSRGNDRGNIRRTTDAFSLATAVLFQNPIQNFAVAPNNLTDQPKVALDFLSEVPTTWDETKYIAGLPGENVILARRHADKWYVAAVNATDSPLSLDVNAIVRQFGGKSVDVIATVGGVATKLVKYNKPLQIPANDGAVIVLTK